MAKNTEAQWHPDTQRWLVDRFRAGEEVGMIASWWRTTPTCVLACLRWALDGYEGDPPKLHRPQGYQPGVARGRPTPEQQRLD